MQRYHENYLMNSLEWSKYSAIPPYELIAAIFDAVSDGDFSRSGVGLGSLELSHAVRNSQYCKYEPSAHMEVTTQALRKVFKKLIAMGVGISYNCVVGYEFSTAGYNGRGDVKVYKSPHDKMRASFLKTAIFFDLHYNGKTYTFGFNLGSEYALKTVYDSEFLNDLVQNDVKEFVQMCRENVMKRRGLL